MRDLSKSLQQHHRLIAIVFWSLYLGVNAVVEALSVITEHARAGLPLERWEPFCWEFSSAVLTGTLIFAVARLNRSFRFAAGSWRLPLVVHMFATVPFSLIHVGGMVALRKLAYLVADRSYDFGNLAVELPYEFRKDFVTYWFILGIFYLWQHLRFLNAARPVGSDGASGPLRRLVARKHGKEFVINTAGIEWIEASGNYANLHHDDGLYPVRASMSELERRLDPDRFARVHRSAIVNLDRAGEIQPTDSGDYLIRMRGGDEVRLSRRYRSRLKDRLAISVT